MGISDMPTFFGRQYMRANPGPVERVVGVCLLLLLGLLVGTFFHTSGLLGGKPIAEPAADAVQKRLVDVGDSDIKAPGDIEIYADNLYEKINGKEGMFRAYHVVDLQFGRYLDTRTGREYDVYVYDMAAPANAFGIYMSERSRSAEVFKVGRDGYRSGTSIFFWKDKFYVNVQGPVDGDGSDFETSRKIATAISDSITDSGEAFWAEAVLPVRERVPHSVSYEATSGLGYDFLKRLFKADYSTGDQPYRLFIHKADSVKGARLLFEQFAEASAKYDKILSRDKSEGGEILVADSLGIFNVAFCKGIYFGGVTECEDKELAIKQAVAFCDGLAVD
jgi:hypothetical protein